VLAKARDRVPAMKTKTAAAATCLVALLVVVLAEAAGVGGTTVTYNDRSLVIDGERRIIISGSIHYPRSTPEVYTES
jgi:hypothetical protein